MSRTSHLLVMALALTAPAVADTLCTRALTPAAERDRIYRNVAANAELAAPSKRRSSGKPSAPVNDLPVANFIDTHISAKLKKDNVYPTILAGDEEFLRRVHLDLTGTIPTPAQVRAFLADTTSDKRSRKIDELLASDAFTDRWTMWFGDLVQNVQVANNSREYYLGRNAYYAYIRESVRSAKPYDQMVRELVAGEGMNFSSGVANYVVRQLQNNGPPQDTYDNLAASSVEKFLGIPMLCISCHSGAGHLETVNWWLRGKSRYDFWKMAAFFAKTSVRGERYTDPANPNVNLVQFNVSLNQLGQYRLNTTDGNKSPRSASDGQPSPVAPAFITTGEQPRAGESYRVAFGRMLTADRQFARAAVNYLWKEMFGVALVEPVNAFDLSKLATQPTHPELLEALADELIAKNYSIRALLRTIATSNTYQLSAQYTPVAWNEAWVPYFARRYPRRMMAEVLMDAVATATSIPPTFNVQGLGTVDKAMELPDPLDGRRTAAGLFMENFGRGDRDDNARSSDSSIGQALAMMNDTTITQRIKWTRRGSTIEKVITATKDPATIVEELYHATLSRKPTAAESQVAVAYLNGGPLIDRTEDLQFVLLNTLEFLFQ